MCIMVTVCNPLQLIVTVWLYLQTNCHLLLSLVLIQIFNHVVETIIDAQNSLILICAKVVTMYECLYVSCISLYMYEYVCVHYIFKYICNAPRALMM